MRVAGISSFVCAAMLLAGCTEKTSGHHAGQPSPGPATGPARVVPGRAPVVWISGRLQAVGPKTVAVVEPTGARVVMRRLAEGATRFLGRSGTSWASLEPASISALESRTAVCAEALRDRGIYLAIRVFVGTACGPRT